MTSRALRNGLTYPNTQINQVQLSSWQYPLAVACLTPEIRPTINGAQPVLRTKNHNIGPMLHAIDNSVGFRYFAVR